MVCNSSRVLQKLLTYRADVAIAAKQTSDPRLHSMLLRTDRLVLFVPVDHPWARQREIALTSLAGQELVLRERGSTTREIFETRLAEAGVTLGAVTEVQTREGVREAVAAGFGIGVTCESEFGDAPKLRKLVMRDADMSVPEYVVCLEERRRMPLVRSFLDLIGPWQDTQVLPIAKTRQA
jgi:DNA-binding transcriptional LysR family regulator